MDTNTQPESRDTAREFAYGKLGLTPWATPSNEQLPRLHDLIEGYRAGLAARASSPAVPSEAVETDRQRGWRGLLCSLCWKYHDDWYLSECQKCGHDYRPTQENENCPECGDPNYIERSPCHPDDGELIYADEDERFMSGYKLGMERAIVNASKSVSRPTWACVEDGLPSEDGVYWVTVDDDSVDEPTTFTAYWGGKGFVTNDRYAADIGSVSAWTEYYTPSPFIADSKGDER